MHYYSVREQTAYTSRIFWLSMCF